MNSSRRALVIAWGMVALFVGVTLTVAGALVAAQRRTAEAAAATLAERVARGTETSLNRTLAGIDLALAGLGRTPDLLPAAGRGPDQARASEILAGVVERTLLFTGLLALDADCRPLASSHDPTLRLGTGLGPAFCRGVLEHPTGQMHISAPVRSESTGEQVLYLVRPVNPPDGRGARWLGAAELPLSQLSALMAQPLEIPGLTVTLERDDGLLLATHPANSPQIGAWLAPLESTRIASETAARLPSRLGEGVALTSVKPSVYRSPIITAGIAQSAIDRELVAERRPILFTAVLLIGAAVAVGLLVQGDLRRSGLAALRTEQAKAMLDQALASIDHGFLLCDADDRVVMWNTRCLEMLPQLQGLITPGIPFAELTAKAGARVWAGIKSDEDVRRGVQERIAAHRQADREYEWTTSDGTHLLGIDRRTADGGTVSIIRDVTRERRSSAELARAKADAEAANEAKSRFLATMSHEIRTPLNGVLGMNALLLDTPLTEEQRRLAEIVRNSGATLLSVINDILDFSRLQAGRMSLDAAPFQPSPLIDGVTSLLGVSCQTKGLTLETDIAPDLPEWVLGDAGRLRQVLFNLIGNAVKFTHEGGVRVEVRHEPVDAGRVAITIAISDTGIGITPAALARLFDRFSQADDSTARRYGGSGLGLAITKELVELMGGTIDVQSREGMGSTFRVRIPMDIAQPPPQAEAPQASPLAQVPPLHVLVAEDNAVNQKLIRALLTRMGHTVDLVEDGEAALRQVQAARYDLVLMDIQMPGMDGETATRRIRALPGDIARIPIVALTANAMAGHREMYLAAGMDEHVAKPVDRDVLARVIAEVIHGKAGEKRQRADAASTAGG